VDVVRLAVVVGDADAEIPDRLTDPVEFVHQEAPATVNGHRPRWSVVVFVQREQRSARSRHRGAAPELRAPVPDHAEAEHAGVEPDGTLEIANRNGDAGDIADGQRQPLHGGGTADQLVDSYHRLSPLKSA
jgi:hypothetical protein